MRALAVFLCSLFVVRSLAAPPQQEQATLLAFLAVVPHAPRFVWSRATPVCSWPGIACDAANSTVVAVHLPAAGLDGPIPPTSLSALSNLRILSLHTNRLSGRIPDSFFSFPQLRSLYVYDNLFSGDIPPSIGGLLHLNHLDASKNRIDGSIPFEVNNLTHLVLLFLQENKLSGSLPAIALPSLRKFNVSSNQLNGSIPSSVEHFPVSAFSGNLALCGAPLPPCNPFFPSPSSAPSSIAVPQQQEHKHRLSAALIAVIAIASALLLLIVVAILVFCCVAGRRRRQNSAATAKGPRSVPLNPSGETGLTTSSSKEELGSASTTVAAADATERNRLVFLGKGSGYSFDLEDLLRASAEVLGKGSFGTSYKAVLEEGTTVVVKRLKDVAVMRREFDAQMQLVGSVEHRNLLPLRAYYYSKDEKLLVFDYLPNGSLSSLLHESRGSGRTPLDWDARMRAAQCAARGLAHLHACHQLVHGNVKSSNLLLRPDPDAAALSDYSLLPLFSPSSSAPAPSRAAGSYRAPEIIDTRRPTFKSDVYSLGVLLLELLTGKSPNHASLGGDDGAPLDLPRWVQSVVREEWTAEVFDVELVRLGESAEEEMVAVLQVAMSCVSPTPQTRPDAVDVVRMLEEVTGTGGRMTEESEDAMRATSEEEPPSSSPP